MRNALFIVARPKVGHLLLGLVGLTAVSLSPDIRTSSVLLAWVLTLIKVLGWGYYLYWGMLAYLVAADKGAKRLAMFIERSNLEEKNDREKRIHH